MRLQTLEVLVRALVDLAFRHEDVLVAVVLDAGLGAVTVRHLGAVLRRRMLGAAHAVADGPGPGFLGREQRAGAEHHRRRKEHELLHRVASSRDIEQPEARVYSKKTGQCQMTN